MLLTDKDRTLIMAIDCMLHAFLVSSLDTLIFTSLIIMVCALKYNAPQNVFNVVHENGKCCTERSRFIWSCEENSSCKYWTIKGPRKIVLKAYFDVTHEVHAVTCNKVIFQRTQDEFGLLSLFYRGIVSTDVVPLRDKFQPVCYIWRRRPEFY